MPSTTTDKLRNGLYLALAFVTALMLWYTVNAKEEVERAVEVRLDYKGLPSGFVVTSGQLNKVSVRLRGPLELLRSLSSRDLAYTMDLSGMTKGSNVIPLMQESLPELRAYKVVEVVPPRLVLEVDHLLETRVPVVARFRESPLTPSLKLEDVTVQPEHVTVRGPATEVSTIKRLVVELPVDLESEDKAIVDDVPVVAPPSVEVRPATVKVKRTITVQRRNVNLQRDLVPQWSEVDNIRVDPLRVQITVSVPRSAVGDVAYMAQVQASLSGKPPSDGAQVVMPVTVTLPAGARLLAVTPDEATVINTLPAPVLPVPGHGVEGGTGGAGEPPKPRERQRPVGGREIGKELTMPTAIIETSVSVKGQ